MRRLKLTLEYDGMPFHGWQRQEGLPTIQGHLEQAFQNITGETVDFFGAGRTDTGVHAWGQVAHVDTESTLPLIKFLDGLNHYTPATIAITDVCEAEEDFHARFSATARTYHYHLYNRRALRPDLVGHAGLCRMPLDISAMEEALSFFPMGEVDCSALRSSACQSTTPKVRMQHLSLQRQEENHLVLHITGNHFLHNMVRIIMGTLIDVGEGKKPVNIFAQLMESKDRTQAGMTFMPDGLYLQKVHYTDDV